jgi:deferrochelatase/peroxidase EfeB
MIDESTSPENRRRFLSGAAWAAAAWAAALTPPNGRAATRPVPDAEVSVPFFGQHPSGITTSGQKHTYFIAFDLVTERREEVVQLLKLWTDAAAELMSKAASFDRQADPQQASSESGAAVGLPISRLTITFGFGAGLFEKDGKDRYGLAKQRPEALVDLPRFVGDQLIPERTGGDLSVQASADDFQVVEAAVRRLAKLARGMAEMRWAQTGFAGGFHAGQTPRNQMGFLDGTINVSTQHQQDMDRFVWVGSEGPAWMRGGSYMVIRPIRISLEHWDDMKLAFQEETIGRHKASGAPIGKKKETDSLGLDRVDAEGNPVVAEFSHAALSAPENNGGFQILRHAFNYDNGIVKVAERWPPWRQLTTFDAGLLFQCYQKDPRTGFIPIFAHMAQFDMLNQFTTHTGSGLFACPPGPKKGEFVGQALLAL